MMINFNRYLNYSRLECFHNQLYKKAQAGDHSDSGTAFLAAGIYLKCSLGTVVDFYGWRLPVKCICFPTL